MYVADTNNHFIRKMSSSGVVTTFAGALNTLPGSSDGAATTATFYFPTGGIAYDIGKDIASMNERRL